MTTKENRPRIEGAASVNRDTDQATSIPRQLRRRRAASQRKAPLECGCPTGRHADPLACLCSFPPLTDHAVDSWLRAAEHVLAAGHMPQVPLEVRRALYRRGGRERQLAELLHRGCGQVAS
jgi:hypothetical protein